MLHSWSFNHRRHGNTPGMHSAPSTSDPEANDGQITTPVWIRIAGAIKLTSLSRSMLYDLMRQGKIRSKVLKQRRDAHHGVRLISYESVLHYIDSHGDDAGGVGFAESAREPLSDVPPKQSAPRAEGPPEACLRLDCGAQCRASGRCRCADGGLSGRCSLRSRLREG